jgi:ATP-dependent DNA ligase
LLAGAKDLLIEAKLLGARTSPAIVFEHACALGCEGIVSKPLGSRYASGRSDAWRKVKNPAAPAVKREREEDWSRRR